MGHSRTSSKLSLKPSSSEMLLHWSFRAARDGLRRRADDGHGRLSVEYTPQPSGLQYYTGKQQHGDVRETSYYIMKILHHHRQDKGWAVKIWAGAWFRWNRVHGIFVPMKKTIIFHFYRKT